MLSKIEIGKIIKKHRKKSGFTQLDLSSDAGISQSHISKIERGDQDILFIDAMAIADCLDFDWFYFIELERNEK